MIKNIVFDIGNVLVDFRLKEFLSEKGFDKPMIKRLLKASVMSPYWERFERADITEQEAMEAFVSLDPEIEEELNEAFENIHGMLTIRDYAVAWVKSLKKAGYQVYYFSNYSKKAYDECRDSLAFMEYMDGGFLSFQQRMTKPDPLMYARFLEQFHLIPQESVFIDDTEQNVAAAEKFGFHGIVFQSYEDAAERLAELGVSGEDDGNAEE